MRFDGDFFFTPYAPLFPGSQTRYLICTVNPGFSRTFGRSGKYLTRYKSVSSGKKSGEEQRNPSPPYVPIKTPLLPLYVFKSLFQKMSVKSKDLLNLVMPHHRKTDTINETQSPSSQAEPEFICQIMYSPVDPQDFSKT